MAVGCIIPPQVRDEALNQFKFDAGNEHEADRIAKYVEWQCQKDAERVTYLEKLRTENVFGADYDCWNVRTDKENDIGLSPIQQATCIPRTCFLEISTIPSPSTSV